MADVQPQKKRRGRRRQACSQPWCKQIKWDFQNGHLMVFSDFHYGTLYRSSVF